MELIKFREKNLLIRFEVCVYFFFRINDDCKKNIGGVVSGFR